MSGDAEENEGSWSEKPTVRASETKTETSVRGPPKDRNLIVRGVRCDDMKGRGAVSEDSIQRATERATEAMLLSLTLLSPHKVSAGTFADRVPRPCGWGKLASEGQVNWNP